MIFPSFSKYKMTLDQDGNLDLKFMGDSEEELICFLLAYNKMLEWIEETKGTKKLRTALSLMPSLPADHRKRILEQTIGASRFFK